MTSKRDLQFQGAGCASLSRPTALGYGKRQPRLIHDIVYRCAASTERQPLGGIVGNKAIKAGGNSPRGIASGRIAHHGASVSGSYPPFTVALDRIVRHRAACRSSNTVSTIAPANIAGHGRAFTYSLYTECPIIIRMVALEHALPDDRSMISVIQERAARYQVVVAVQNKTGAPIATGPYPDDPNPDIIKTIKLYNAMTAEGLYGAVPDFHIIYASIDIDSVGRSRGLPGSREAKAHEIQGDVAGCHGDGKAGGGGVREILGQAIKTRRSNGVRDRIDLGPGLAPSGDHIKPVVSHDRGGAQHCAQQSQDP